MPPQLLDPNANFSDRLFATPHLSARGDLEMADVVRLRGAVVAGGGDLFDDLQIHRRTIWSGPCPPDHWWARHQKGTAKTADVRWSGCRLRAPTNGCLD